MAMVWPGPPGEPGEPGEPAEFPNRLFFIVYFSQNIIIFEYFLHFRQCREGFKAIFKAAFLHFRHCREGFKATFRAAFLHSRHCREGFNTML